MQEERYFDKKSDEWIEGYILGSSQEYDMVITSQHCEEDELYCVQRVAQIWIMIDTPTAVRWGL